ncbi:MAG: hypothetical protein LBD89_08180 [Tannerellaceae bacterium]|jgi:hypothetical protein|nr:hypothetical protein [Tannerellaceae bacterium]
MNKRTCVYRLLLLALLLGGCDEIPQPGIDPPPRQKEEPTEEAEYNGPFVDYPDSVAVVALKDLPAEKAAEMVQGKWSVYLAGGGITTPVEVAPNEMSFVFSGTDHLRIHSHEAGTTFERTINKWKRTSFGYLLFTYKDDMTGPYYWLQHFYSRDTLEITVTTSPFFNGGGTFCFYMTRFEP